MMANRRLDISKSPLTLKPLCKPPCQSNPVPETHRTAGVTELYLAISQRPNGVAKRGPTKLSLAAFHSYRMLVNYRDYQPVSSSLNSLCSLERHEWAGTLGVAAIQDRVTCLPELRNASSLIVHSSLTDARMSSPHPRSY